MSLLACRLFLKKWYQTLPLESSAQGSSAPSAHFNQLGVGLSATVPSCSPPHHTPRGSPEPSSFISAWPSLIYRDGGKEHCWSVPGTVFQNHCTDSWVGNTAELFVLMLPVGQPWGQSACSPSAQGEGRERVHVGPLCSLHHPHPTTFTG